MSAEQITVADGKYSVINDNGKLTALRNGEPWQRDLTGDNLVYWMFVRIRELEAAQLAPAAQSAVPESTKAAAAANSAATEAERLLEAIGGAAHRLGIYNGEAPLSGPLALMLLNDMVGQMGLPPREQHSSVEPEARALAEELGAAALSDDNDPEGHDISGGLIGPNVSAWLRKIAAERLNASIHPESGMTADQLWMETGRLRARLADAMDARSHATQATSPANAVASPQIQAVRIPATGSSFMRPMVSRALPPTQQSAPANLAASAAAPAAADAAIREEPARSSGLRKLKR